MKKKKEKIILSDMMEYSDFFVNVITKIPEEILSREVKSFGNGSAHVLIPKKHIGKEVKILIHKKNKEEKNNQ